MSLISTVANYGGRQPNNTSYIKQFVESASSFVTWIFKKTNGITYIEPSNTSKPIRIPQNVIINGDLTVYGIFNNPSDETIKKNIWHSTGYYLSLDDGTDCKIMELNPCEFQYKKQKEEDTRIHHGFIAQEVEKVFPELIGTTEDEEGNQIKTVNYIEMIPLLLTQLHIFREKINRLETDIENIKERI